jgi:hypothetical protein
MPFVGGLWSCAYFDQPLGPSLQRHILLGMQADWGTYTTYGDSYGKTDHAKMRTLCDARRGYKGVKKDIQERKKKPEQSPRRTTRPQCDRNYTVHRSGRISVIEAPQKSEPEEMSFMDLLQLVTVARSSLVAMGDAVRLVAWATRAGINVVWDANVPENQLFLQDPGGRVLCTLHIRQIP